MLLTPNLNEDIGRNSHIQQFPLSFSQGELGSMGKQGLPGNPGAVGPVGPKGAQGQNGADGDDVSRKN